MYKLPVLSCDSWRNPPDIIGSRVSRDWRIGSVGIAPKKMWTRRLGVFQNPSAEKGFVGADWLKEAVGGGGRYHATGCLLAVLQRRAT